ncbi:MAG: hypothetical protein ACXVP0_09275 [Bacteroidia bacterium]
MKKITILAIAAVALSFTACKKDRVCTCTDSDTTTWSGTSSGSSSDSDSHVTTYTKATKATASANCLSKKYTSTYTAAGTTYVTTTDETCTLK